MCVCAKCYAENIPDMIETEILQVRRLPIDADSPIAYCETEPATEGEAFTTKYYF